MSADGLVEYLRARIAEDRERAMSAQEADGPWLAGTSADHLVDTVVYRPSTWPGRIVHACNTEYAGPGAVAIAEFIAANGPARVLAWCDVIERIIDLHMPETGHLGGDNTTYAICTSCGGGGVHEYATDWPCHTVRLLTVLFADRNDYVEAWRPLTERDPEPTVGSVVTDALGRQWERAPEGYWLRVGQPAGDPESWVKIAGNYGPVTACRDRPC